MLRTQRSILSLIGVEAEGSIIKWNAYLLDFGNFVPETIIILVSMNI
jgi:hypothetical protein